jgi:D-serine deaminase-like pyridoxal phosphate-dependent protein
MPVPSHLGLLESNISRLQTYRCTKIANRPHIKTQDPEIAQMQIDAGAGITCQKVSEAEVMADAASMTFSSHTISSARTNSQG